MTSSSPSTAAVPSTSNRSSAVIEEAVADTADTAGAAVVVEEIFEVDEMVSDLSALSVVFPNDLYSRDDDVAVVAGCCKAPSVAAAVAACDDNDDDAVDVSLQPAAVGTGNGTGR